MLKPLRTDAQAPWKQRFRIPTFLSSQVARTNATRGVICSNASGAFQLSAWDISSGTLWQRSHERHGALVGMISPDGSYIYYPVDPDGDQFGHIVRVPFEGGNVQDITPDFPPYPCYQICLSAAGTLLAFPVPRSDEQGTDLYVVPLGLADVGQPRRIFHDPSPGFLGRKRLALSADGSILVFASQQRDAVLVERLLAIDTETGQLIGELWDGAENSVSMVDFSPVPGDGRLLAKWYRGDREQTLLWDPLTGEQRLLEWNLDSTVQPVGWSPNGTQLLLYQGQEADQCFVVFSLVDDTFQRLSNLSGSILYATFGGNNEIFVHHEEHRPAEVIVLDSITGQIKGTRLSGGPLPPEQPWTSVIFSSSDGQLVQGWLIKPEGEGPFPVILHMHGGPHEQAWQHFSPELQLWIDHGFAVFSVNYRGSTGFGDAFQAHIIGNPGYWELEDIVAGRNWLVQQGIACQDAILLTGWSYGGYLTLLALGKYPELWAGGMAGYAIADWSLLHAEVSEGLQFTWLFGGTLEEKPEQYRVSSPITYAERVKVPLFIYQGRNDPGCPPRQMEHYVARLQELGKHVEIIWLEAGHGTLNTAQEIMTQEHLLRFAYRVVEAGREEEHV
jgi:dienelactone hydrolase/Tol biopolymer transport system component